MSIHGGQLQYTSPRAFPGSSDAMDTKDNSIDIENTRPFLNSYTWERKWFRLLSLPKSDSWLLVDLFHLTSQLDCKFIPNTLFDSYPFLSKNVDVCQVVKPRGLLCEDSSRRGYSFWLSQQRLMNEHRYCLAV